MAFALQEREDLQMATELEQTESSVKLARSLSRPVVMEQSPAPFTRSGSGNMGRPPSPGHPFSAQDSRGAPMSRSKTFGAKIESPVLKQKSFPLSAGKKSNSNLHQVIPESPAREMIRIGSIPREGHPFLQTAADQQLFKEREETLVVAGAPPAYAPTEQSAVPTPREIETPPPPGPPASGTESAPPEPGPSAEEPEEESPVPPPPFSGLPSSKLKPNKRRK